MRSFLATFALVGGCRAYRMIRAASMADAMTRAMLYAASRMSDWTIDSVEVKRLPDEPQLPAVAMEDPIAERARIMAERGLRAA